MEKFKDFIEKSKETVLQSKEQSVLVSYFHELENFDIKDFLNLITGDFEKSFYWNKPSSGVEYLGLGIRAAFTENGNFRFFNAEKEIKELRKNFKSNQTELGLEDIPLFVGSAKFSPEHDNEIWNHYEDLNIFIPKIAVIKKAGKNYLLHNFIANSAQALAGLEDKFSRNLQQVSEWGKNSATENGGKISAKISESPKEKKKFIDNVKEAIEKINMLEIDKIVLSRIVEVNLNGELPIKILLDKLAARYPDCAIFAFHSARSTFFGASPELLLKVNGKEIYSEALAGSISRGKDENEDAKLAEHLLNDEKEIFEHKFVVDYIKNAFSEFCEDFECSDSPKIKKLSYIQHLWTPIKGNLKPDARIFQLIENLHPTPAVCGSPSSAALNHIKKLEKHPRGLYSGIVGWFNFNNVGEFYVGLRSALYKDKKAYLYVGGGIVNQSDPIMEFKETELKLKSILSLFRDEN